MKWSFLNHKAIKMFSPGKIKWRIKLFCSEPGTILTVNLTTLMEWEGTHLNRVKIKDTSLPELSLNALQPGLAFASYLTLTTETVRSSDLSSHQNTGKLQSIDKIRIKEKEVRKLEAREMKKQRAPLSWWLANKSVGWTHLACELSFQKGWKGGFLPSLLQIRLQCAHKRICK